MDTPTLWYNFIHIKNLIMLQKIGKWLFILPFAVFGFLHFGPLEFSLPYIPSCLPFPPFWVYFTGVCLLSFTLSAILKKYDGLAEVGIQTSLSKQKR